MPGGVPAGKSGASSERIRPPSPKMLPVYRDKLAVYAGKLAAYAGTNPQFDPSNSQFGGTNSHFDVSNSQFDGTNSHFDGTNSQFTVINSQFYLINSQFMRANSANRREEPKKTQARLHALLPPFAIFAHAKIGCGSAKSNLKTVFSFAFTLTFHYLCTQINHLTNKAITRKLWNIISGK